MHELSLAGRIIEIVTAEIAGTGLSRIDAITVKVGELSQVMPDSLRFGFECLRQDTPLAGAELIIEEVPARGRCTGCEKEFTVENRQFLCPECGKPGIVILSGNELQIVELEGV